ncbi:MAG: endolytic transglycosylase MltG [Clostridium sp.]|jgi:UPF0755 protein|nr:endolytic transglycosylase MltG [Clostridium sp.]
MAENQFPNGEDRRSPNVRRGFVVNFDDGEFGGSQQAPTAGERKSAEKRGVYFASAPGSKQPISSHAVKPAAAKQGTKKKRRKNSTSAAVGKSVLISVLLVICSTLLAFWGGICMNDILAFDRDDDLVMVSIPQGAETNEIIDILKEDGLIRQKWFCKLFYKVFHTSKDKDGNEIKPNYLTGVYYVKANEGLEGLLNTFKSLPASAKTITVVFPEGYTIPQIFDRLQEMGVCRKEHLYQAMQNVSFDYEFLKDVPADSTRPYKLEGYLFPAQYEFYEGEDANSVLRRLLSAYESRWTAAYQKKADALGMTMDEVITLASIIQKEAGDNAQMKGISYVIHNRLNHSAAWPSIGCDSTMEYITLFAQVYLTNAQKEAYTKLYNTNGSEAVKGLPPGPICSPGEAAIEAALNPESPDGKSYYYFVHDKYGKIYYCQTQKEFDVTLQQIRAMN